MTVYLAAGDTRYATFDAMNICLAYGGPPDALAKGLGDDFHRPALLVAYPYLRQFFANKARLSLRHWVLDSGAYTAWNQGIEISNSDFIAKAKELKESDPALKEVFALDVIGDAKASMDNAIEMTKAKATPSVVAEIIPAEKLLAA